jgi:hypothetical protein
MTRRPPLPAHAVGLLDSTPHRPIPGCPCGPLPGVDLLTPSRTIYWHPHPVHPEPDPLEVALAARLAADAEEGGRS